MFPCLLPHPTVTNLEPFLKNTTPSTAFCLLYKLWTLKLTIKQVEGLIDHVDSPYIRGIGFLYLRFVCAPAKLWEWFDGYLEDEEPIQVSGGVRPITTVSYLFSLPCIPHRIIVFYLLQNHWTPLSRPPYGAEIPRHDAPAYSRPHRARHRPEVARL
ncbi:PRP38 family-domain-containing protein [Jimgerdemannia flammicorona]|uniref:Pre-mRNA-splicing factor 38 n=1 Tax=Jimgerdemannia flammicorona TaxID=994334 RepID=A0A433DKV9_9FUNG|nr:PRP38 family-domain-containing protein [Jimgerdemannia flammicorona]